MRRKDIKQIKVKCAHCGRVYVGRVPKSGTGDFLYPRRHKVKGISCPGNYEEGIWIEKLKP